MDARICVLKAMRRPAEAALERMAAGRDPDAQIRACLLAAELGKDYLGREVGVTSDLSEAVSGELGRMKYETAWWRAEVDRWCGRAK